MPNAPDSPVRIRLFVTPWTVAHQAALSMGFSRQKYWYRVRTGESGLVLSEEGNPAGLSSCSGSSILACRIPWTEEPGGHQPPMPPPETPRHTQASLGPSLVGYNIPKNYKTKQVAFPPSTYKPGCCFFMTSFPLNGCPCMFPFNFSLDKGEEKGLLALTPSVCF